MQLPEDIRRKADCPKCKAVVGEYCQTPSGQATHNHYQRLHAYLAINPLTAIKLVRTPIIYKD